MTEAGKSIGFHFLTPFLNMCRQLPAKFFQPFTLADNIKCPFSLWDEEVDANVPLSVLYVAFRASIIR